MPNIDITPMRAEHIAGFHACLDAVARERKHISRVVAPSLADMTRFVEHMIAHEYPQFAALHEDVVVGWCDIIPERVESFKHRGVLGMGVAKDYRGQGLGERLARATIQQAHLHRLERVELLVFAANARARKLYEKLGFIVEGTKKNARKLDGVYDDVIEMVLFLEDYVA